MKRNISFLICFCLCSFLLLACGKSGSEENDTDKFPIKNDADGDNDHQNPLVENIPTNGNEDSDNETVFQILENYKEENIPSVYEQGNEDEFYCNVCLDKNMKIIYYTFSKDSEGYHIWKYTLEENLEENNVFWKRESVLWTMELSGEISRGRVRVFYGEDGEEYAWYIDDDEKTHLVKRTEDSFVEIKNLDLRETDFRQIAVLENGNVVSPDLGRECFIYNQEDGRLLANFLSGWYESLCVEGNQVYITDQTGMSVQHYDAEQQEFSTMIEGNFDTSVRIAIQNDNIYACTMKGIYCAPKTGGRFQKILDSGTYHFAKESGVLLKLFVIGDAFYILYGEDEGVIKKYFPKNLEETEIITNSLKIYSLESNDVIIDMISEFQDKYPDTEIIYETGEGAAGSVTTYDSIRALNVRILAGDGPDILVLDGLPVESYCDKGILKDMTMDIRDLKEKLLPNILMNYVVEDKMYMLPARFSIPMFLTSGQDAEVYSSLRAFVEYSEEKGGILPKNYLYSDFLEILYYNYTPEIVLEDGRVDKEKTAEFLGLVKRLCEAEQAVGEAKWPATYLEGRSSVIPFSKGDADFAFVNMTGGYALGLYPNAVLLRNGELVCNNGMFFPNTLLGINQLSENREMASAFIRFAFSYETQKRHVGDYPIHTRVLDELAQMDNSNLISGDSDLILRYADQKQNEQMIQIVKQVHTPFTVDKAIWEIIEKESMAYLKEEKSLDNSVDAIASRIQLYLYEQ